VFLKLLNKKKGFTIIELMMVVLILGLLTAIGIPAYEGIKEYAERRIVETNLQLINGAISMYLTTGNDPTQLTSVEKLVPKFLEHSISGPKKATYSIKKNKDNKLVAVVSSSNEKVGGHVLNEHTYDTLPWTD